MDSDGRFAIVLAPWLIPVISPWVAKAGVAIVAGVALGLSAAKLSEQSKESDTNKEKIGESGQDKESTPATKPGNFENVKGSKAKRDKNTGEIWEKDNLHKDHYEVYKNKKKWEQGERDRSVWEKGTLKDKF